MSSSPELALTTHHSLKAPLPTELKYICNSKHVQSFKEIKEYIKMQKSKFENSNIYAGQVVSHNKYIKTLLTQNLRSSLKSSTLSTK